MIRFLIFSGILAGTLNAAVISGFVYDDSTGERLAGANVFLQNTRFGAATNNSGYFVIADVPPSQYLLVCHFIGYFTFQKKVELGQRQQARIDIRLAPTTLETQAITVLADSAVSDQSLYQRPVSQISIKPRHIGKIPQILESDLLRTLTRLPGIVAVSDYSSEIYVRGGTPDQNLYLMDGAQIYNPEHFFGLFSVFNTDAIKDVWISKGGFGANYGGRLSSVLNVTNLDGNRKQVKNTTSVSLLSARTTMQLPLGSIGSLSGSFRRTYFDETIARLKIMREKNIPDYYFWDGHLKAFIDLNNNNKLTCSFFNSSDKLNYVVGENPEAREHLLYNWGNRTASAKWTVIPNPTVYGDLWVVYSRFGSDFKFMDFQEDNGISDITAKFALEYYYTQKLLFQAGGEHTTLTARYNARFPAGIVDIDQNAVFDVLYGQAVWQPTPRLEIQAGCRLNRFRNEKVFLQPVPRFSAKYQLFDFMSLKAAAGSYRQYLFRVPRTFVSDIWALSNREYNNSRADHFITGVQCRFAGLEVEVEGYLKNYGNLLFYDPFFFINQFPAGYDSLGHPEYNRLRHLFHNGSGFSYGGEVLLRKDSGVVNGWVSCAISRTRYKINAVNSGLRFAPRHDRFATINIVCNMDVRNSIRFFLKKNPVQYKNKWQVGAGFVYAAGQPITTTSSVYVVRPLPDQDFYSGYELYPGKRNGFRLPPYIRLDFSLTYSRRVGRILLQPYVQVYNVTDRKNVWFIQYRDNLENGKILQDVDTFSMLPILPSAGLTIIF
ncbi:carboxypeptidase-like regulatory domain-containing protein [candidate division KSB1 bacterium]|nr:carboxypeptidase-like regulatory domain-containing protein [candidate division KSB1 bacterium]